VTHGDFHDGSNKGTASVHKILCQSWEKCYGNPRNDSTRLRGPKLESYTGIYTFYCLIRQLTYLYALIKIAKIPSRLHKRFNELIFYSTETKWSINKNFVGISIVQTCVHSFLSSFTHTIKYFLNITFNKTEITLLLCSK
jgi:hypothetical protein